jgi:hypothetical protein
VDQFFRSFWQNDSLLTHGAKLMKSPQSNEGERYVVGPYGERLTLNLLPRPGSTHWTPRRKAQLVAAVNGGLLTRNELLRRYSITPLEFETWLASANKFGMLGLRSTRVQDYKDLERRFPDLERPAPKRSP